LITSNGMSTRKRTLLLWVVMLLVPPLGLFLLWRRRDWGITGKIISSVAGLVIFTIWIPPVIITLNLHDILGYHIDWNGHFSHWMVNRDTKSAVAERLEADRAKQRPVEPPPAPAPAPASAPPAAESPTLPPAASPRVSGLTVNPAYWTDFRGPNRAGVYSDGE